MSSCTPNRQRRVDRLPNDTMTTTLPYSNYVVRNTRVLLHTIRQQVFHTTRSLFHLDARSIDRYHDNQKRITIFRRAQCTIISETGVTSQQSNVVNEFCSYRIAADYQLLQLYGCHMTSIIKRSRWARAHKLMRWSKEAHRCITWLRRPQ